MTVKVNYDIKTTLVKGYYPDSIGYSSIPEPFIEISDKQHQEGLGKQMCVVDGVFQEYVLSQSEQLDAAKITKIAEVKTARQVFQELPITIDGQTFSATESAKNKFWAKVNRYGTPSNYSINWLLTDGVTWISLNKTQAYALYDAMEAQEDSAYKQQSIYLAAIEAATSLEELNNININFE